MFDPLPPGLAWTRLEPDRWADFGAARRARATDLTGLPSTYIEVGSAEVFCDEDVEYASRI